MIDCTMCRRVCRAGCAAVLVVGAAAAAVAAAATTAAAATAYWKLARPRFTRWGATDDELVRSLPGDERLPDANSTATRAVTIAAPAGAIWPWLAQMGQHRAGMYSYTWLENLFLANMRNADEIVPEWQEIAPGDIVRLADPSRFGGKGFCVVGEVDPGKSLVLLTSGALPLASAEEFEPAGTWAFVLEPIDDSHTRLLVRGRGVNRSAAEKAASYLWWDWTHFIMERGMMLGIKERAQRAAAA